MFESLYESAWHHPAICFVGVAALLLLLARQLPFLHAYLVVFAAEIAVDALFTGAWSPVPKEQLQGVAIAFVILGDWRFLLLFERFSRRPGSRVFWVSSIALAFVVPLFQAACIKLWPERFADARRVFLVYELAFAAFAIVLLGVVLPRRARAGGLADADLRFVRAITRFFLVQYLLWASVDLLILGGHAWALALRVVPNTLYYAGFLLFVWWRAPDAPPRRGGPALALAGVSLALGIASIGHRPAEAVGPEPVLEFQINGAPARRLSLAQLRATASSERWTAYDPYYGRQKTWHALPLAAVLAAGYAGRLDGPDPLASARAREFTLRAVDGYAVHMSGDALLEGGGYIAYADAEVAGWEPIGSQRAHPGPFYLVWRHEHQQDLASHPRPWALAEIDAVTFEEAYPHTIPPASASAAARRGFDSFRARCLRCHAMNNEGGHVGPDLNVPQSILEYRPAAQVKAYIRDPKTFRHSAMPPHPELDDRALEDLLAYFEVMRTRKHDVGAGAGGAAHP